MIRVKHIVPFGIRLPLTTPMRRRKGDVRTSENVLVRVDAGDFVGWGEAGSAPAMTGELLRGMIDAVSFLAPHLEGAKLDDIAGIAAIMDRNLYANPGAKAAIEMALHDALGKSLGKPVYALFGEQYRDRIAALRYLASGDATTDAREAAELSSQGYLAFKIKIGAASVAQEIERTRRVCEAVGPGALVSADVNQGWNADQAIEYVRALADTPLAFLEQPVPADDIAGMAKAAAASRIEIGCDEGLRHCSDLDRHHAARAAHGASLKIGKLGGMRPVYDAAARCRALGMKVNLACKIAESGIGTAAILHLAAAIPSLDWGVSLTSQYLAEDVLAAPLSFSAGHVHVPSGPGLGVEVDEERVKRFSVGHA
ncbi:MAG: mandelate racemase/muconate lactonizing enzyme family protein [Burkholderiales bacterium]